MSRSNSDKPFYVDVGTSIVAVRCASNHDVVIEYDHMWRKGAIEEAERVCDRLNKEVDQHQHKMREALENIKQEAETTCEYRDYPIAGFPGERGSCPVVDADWIIDTCKTALSKPPRNCDVGTAEE